jgi:hypothetical protein
LYRSELVKREIKKLESEEREQQQQREIEAKEREREGEARERKAMRKHGREMKQLEVQETATNSAGG